MTPDEAKLTLMRTEGHSTKQPTTQQLEEACRTLGIGVVDGKWVKVDYETISPPQPTPLSHAAPDAHKIPPDPPSTW